jgi:hypothetical protein
MGDETNGILRKQSRRHQKRREVSIPGKFTPRFWEDSDNRIGVVKLIRRRYEQLKAHAGGEESTQRDLLCQRCAFVSVILETKEVEAAENNDLDLGSYVQGVNCLQGLLRALGLERRMKSVGGLQTYLKEREGN